jgi:hypothetical protein
LVEQLDSLRIGYRAPDWIALKQVAAGGGGVRCQYARVARVLWVGWGMPLLDAALLAAEFERVPQDCYSQYPQDRGLVHALAQYCSGFQAQA